MSDPYRLRIARPAAKALTDQLPEKVAHAVYKFTAGPLLDDPGRAGMPLDPPMPPAWTVRPGSHRFFYLLDDRNRVVEVTAIHHRAERTCREVVRTA